MTFIQKDKHFLEGFLIITMLVFFSACSNSKQEKIGSTFEKSTDGLLKLLIIGIDGMEPRLINKYIKDGKMPNLKGLIENGSSTIINTRLPLTSPIIWTTIATSAPPKVHGITDFVINGTPINSSFRKVPAFWNILESNFIKAATVGWWATWPAEKNAGIMISFKAFWGSFKEKVYPENVIDTHKYNNIKYLKNLDFLKRFTSYPFDKKYKKNLKRGDRQYLLNDLIKRRLIGGYIRDEIFTDIAVELLEKHKPEALAIYLEGIDYVEHAFWQFMEPEPFRKEGWDINDKEIKHLKNVIPEYHKYTDELLGRLLKYVDPDTLTLVISDHGFGPAPYLKKKSPELGLSGNHKKKTFFILSGSQIVKSKTQTTTVYHVDLLPTALYGLGLPLARDFYGRPLLEYFTDNYLEKRAVRYVNSYTEKRRRKVKSKHDDEIKDDLRSLGYID